MAVTLFNTLRSFVVPPFFTVILASVMWSCGFHQNSPSKNDTVSQGTKVWYRQAIGDLGHRIQMFSPNDGVAISRGRGRDVKGIAYRSYFRHQRICECINRNN